MKFTLATVAAVAALLPSMASAHLKLTNPGTFGNGDPLPPLEANGSNFPCTDLADNGDGETYQPGSTQSVRLAGTAVHSGGSCQISFTYDSPPNRNSVWKVVKSFHGGCPVNVNGNLPDDPAGPTANLLDPLNFVVPSDLPSGKAVLAWTWFNKSGNREMYMRCAKVTIAGSNTNRAGFNALPDMFIANIGNGCTVPEGADIAFPNPGNEVEGSATGSPTGNCGASGPAPPQQQDSPPPQPSPTQSDSPTPQPSPTQAPQPSPTQDNSNNSNSGSDEGACTEGQIICDSPTTFSMCNDGQVVSIGEGPPGTTCQNGQFVKRNIRFSAEHLKRAAENSRKLANSHH